MSTSTTRQPSSEEARKDSLRKDSPDGHFLQAPLIWPPRSLAQDLFSKVNAGTVPAGDGEGSRELPQRAEAVCPTDMTKAGSPAAPNSCSSPASPG